jgi:hypothetical protein
VEGLTPNSAAIVRVLQWVCLFGLECSVFFTIASTVSSLIDGFGPRPLRTSPSLDNPSSANRLRQDRTVTAVTPASAAILVLASPAHRAAAALNAS